jgi:hypothetical protein
MAGKSIDNTYYMRLAAAVVMTAIVWPHAAVGALPA